MPKLKFAVVALLPLMAACQTQEAIAPAASVSLTSLCQVDRELSYSVAPTENADDAGNKWDTDATIRDLIAHNARYRAACAETK